jgi:hypothetical protein
MTHLKIVAVALICATIVAGIGIAARVTDRTITSKGLEANVIKAGAPIVLPLRPYLPLMLSV